MINLLVRGFTELWRQYGPKWKLKPIFYTGEKENDEGGSIKSHKGTDRSLTHVIQAHEESLRQEALERGEEMPRFSIEAEEETKPIEDLERRSVAPSVRAPSYRHVSFLFSSQ